MGAPPPRSPLSSHVCRALVRYAEGLGKRAASVRDLWRRRTRGRMLSFPRRAPCGAPTPSTATVASGRWILNEFLATPRCTPETRGEWIAAALD